MNKFNFQKTVNKYAILLALFYTLSLVWFYYFNRYLTPLLFSENHAVLREYLSYFHYVISVISNIVFAVLVYKDLKTNGIKNPLIVIITLLFGFLGIALFFIQLIYELYIKKSSI